MLSPYGHRLNSRGTGCAEDCSACLWVQGNTLSTRAWTAIFRPLSVFKMVNKLRTLLPRFWISQAPKWDKQQNSLSNS